MLMLMLMLMVEVGKSRIGKDTGQAELNIPVLSSPVYHQPQPGVIQSELAGKDLGVFRGDRHVRNPVLRQNQLSCPSENGGNPPQQFSVPLCDPVPHSPHVLPTLKASPIEEGLVDPVCVVYVGPLTNVDQVAAPSYCLVGRDERRCSGGHVVASVPVRPGHHVPLEVGEVVEEDFWLKSKLQPPLAALLPPLWPDAIHRVPVDP